MDEWKNEEGESDDISMKVDEVPTSDKMGRNAGRCFSHVL